MLLGWHYEYSSQRHDTTKSEVVPMAMKNACTKVCLTFPLSSVITRYGIVN